MHSYWRLFQWPSHHTRLHFPGSYRCSDDVRFPLVAARTILTNYSAAYVKAQAQFKRNNQMASIGKYAFGFEWASFACFFLATVFFCVGGSAGKKDSYGSSKKKGGFFKGKRSQSTRSRGSFIKADKEYS